MWGRGPCLAPTTTKSPRNEAKVSGTSWQCLSNLLKVSWESKGTPPMPPPAGNKALLRDY